MSKRYSESFKKTIVQSVAQDQSQPSIARRALSLENYCPELEAENQFLKDAKGDFAKGQ